MAVTSIFPLLLLSPLFQTGIIPKRGSDRRRLLPRTSDPAFSAPLNSSTKLIVIVAAFRSGSTFLGEVFNQNPAVLYDFESFHWLALENRKKDSEINGAHPRHTDDELNLLYLQQILHNCSILPPMFADVAHKYWQCGRNKQENMELFGNEACSDNIWSMKTIKGIRQFHCKKRESVVIKLIRLRRIKDLELIQNIRQADVKIIHLLRDPRALFRSRVGYKEIFATKRNKLNWVVSEKFSKIGIEAHTECENYVNDIKYARRSIWLLDRYLQVRHDQMSVDPEGTAQKIYKFVGLDMPETVRSYVNGTGNIDTGTNRFFGEDAGKEKGLSTLKDSKEILKNWMKWEIKPIKHIEAHCARLIRLMNLPFVSQPELEYSELGPNL